MENIKKFLFAIILLGVIAFLWIGMELFFEGKEKTLSDSVESYTTQIAKSFDLEELDEVYEKTEELFPVSSREFLDLIEQKD